MLNQTNRDNHQNREIEKKKNQLHEEFGMDLEHYQADLPPELESEWLDHVLAFEKQFEKADRISVRSALGDAHFPPLSEVVHSNLSAALEKLLEMLFENGIVVDFLFEVSDAEAYRFIVEELFDQEIDVVHLPGLKNVFIYEEFHPNDVEESKHWANEFLEALFEKNNKMMQVAYGRELFLDGEGNAISLTEFETLIDAFHRDHPVVTSFQIDPVRVIVEGDEASVDFQTSWDSITRDKERFCVPHGISKVKLKRSPFSGWDVIQFRLCGWVPPS